MNQEPITLQRTSPTGRDRVEELIVALPRVQAAALEAAAARLGVTTAQLLRRIISRFLDNTTSEIVDR